MKKKEGRQKKLQLTSIFVSLSHWRARASGKLSAILRRETHNHQLLDIRGSRYDCLAKNKRTIVVDAAAAAAVIFTESLYSLRRDLLLERAAFVGREK